MIHDHRIKKIVDFQNAKDCFPETSIGGGVNYFLWVRDYSGNCEVENIQNNIRSVSLRRLDEFPVFVRNNDAINIIHKARKFVEPFISTLISSRNPFGFPSSARVTTMKIQIKLNYFQANLLVISKETLLLKDSMQ